MTDPQDCEHPPDSIRPVVSEAHDEENIHVLSATMDDGGLIVFAECEHCGAEFDINYEYVEAVPTA